MEEEEEPGGASSHPSKLLVQGRASLSQSILGSRVAQWARRPAASVAADDEAVVTFL